MSKISLPKMLLLAGVALCAVVLGFWQVKSDEHRVQHPKQSPWNALMLSAQGAVSLANSEAAQVQAFRFMRTASEVLPIHTQRHISENIGMPINVMRLAYTQRVYTKDGALWIVDGPNTMCIAEPGEGPLTCATIAEAVQRGLTINVFMPPKRISESPRNFKMLGVVPDWARVARVSVGGTMEQVHIHHNTFSVHADQPLRLVSLGN